MILLIYCPDPSVANRFRAALADDDSSSLLWRPVLFSRNQVPLITDQDTARAAPAAVVFGALAHADDPDVDEAFPILATILETAAPQNRRRYHHIVLAGLPADTRIRWRDYVTTAKLPYLSEEFNQLHFAGVAEGKAQGVAEGKAQDVLLVLETRQIQVPESDRARILSTTDLDVLDGWLRRAVTADSIGEVLTD